MTRMNPIEVEEAELQRRGQELAVAWCKGRSGYVLDSLSSEPPLRAALIATLVYELLGRWDPYDCKWPKSFWRALLGRSQGMMTSDELAELEAEYRRRFGVSAPPTDRAACGPDALPRVLGERAEDLRQALAAGRPIRPRRADPPSMFLRPHVRQAQENTP